MPFSFGEGEEHDPKAARLRASMAQVLMEGVEQMQTERQAGAVQHKFEAEVHKAIQRSVAMETGVDIPVGSIPHTPRVDLTLDESAADLGLNRAFTHVVLEL